MKKPENPPPKQGAAPKKLTPKQARDDMAARAKGAPLPPDPLSPQALKAIAPRVGIGLAVLAVLWVLAVLSQSWIVRGVMGVLTLVVAGVLVWVIRFARRSRAVASIVQGAGDTAESRKEAIAKLETDFKKDDAEAVLAKAQIQLQDNDRQGALRTLETVKLDKVLAPIADQTRIMRASIHLVEGETEEARQLADAIDMAQQKEPKTRAGAAAVVGESWARSGQAKRAVELLETIDINDAVYAELRPQLFRALAFAYAWASDTQKMKQVLRKIAQINPQMLAGFVTRKKIPGGVNPRGVHPLLEKEALEMLTRSGAVPRKMEFRRG